MRSLTHFLLVAVASGLVCALQAKAAGPENVLLIVNESSRVSRQVAHYYRERRSIPSKNVCPIKTPEQEKIRRSVYNEAIAKPIRQCLQSRNLAESILYLVTTKGVPLIILGTTGIQGDYSSVDSELTLLYQKDHELAGPVRNPFYGQRDTPFSHPQFAMYLVTRLTGFGLPEIRAIIDRSMQAAHSTTARGKVVLDLRGDDSNGDRWLKRTAMLLPAARVTVEETSKPLYRQTGVIGFASWGSNDSSRTQRLPEFRWLPGAIMTEFVSTNGRTFSRPPEGWTIGSWKDSRSFFAGSPQTLIADYLTEGATGASGHVDEPFLEYTPRPEFLFPAYLSGRNLAESYWMSIPALSWQNVVVGDPLCTVVSPATNRK